MTHAHVIYIYQAVAFLFALSVHEASHAWMASRLGDQTARMLGRVTLNPLSHIDPIGTILMPAIAFFTGNAMIGWAKPTPVDARFFRNYMRDDILTTLAGPLSNMLIATCSFIVLVVLAFASPTAHGIVKELGYFSYSESDSIFLPICILLHVFVQINILLTIFNLLPFPPLDGSHVVQHFLPEGIRSIYSQMGVLSMVLFFTIGGKVIGILEAPVLAVFSGILQRL